MAKHVYAEVRAEIRGEELQLTPEQMEERALENAKKEQEAQEYQTRVRAQSKYATLI